MKKPVVLIIMDGYGLAPPSDFNAVSLANTPYLDRLFETCPNTWLTAHGEAVGLPPGQMGNSEVGHTNIGAGRIVYQDLPRITKSIEDGDFYENPAFLKAIANCKANNSALHVMGLLSDGGVHSHMDQGFALLELAKNHGLEKVYLHCFLDGRDVPPESGKAFVIKAEETCRKSGAVLATVMGRYYGMDRDNEWDRVKLAYDAIVNGEGSVTLNPISAVEESYKNGATDEFMKPVITSGYKGVCDKDSIIFYNFRPDRARQITRSIVDPDFTGFNRQRQPAVEFVCMTQYDAKMPKVSVAYLPQVLTDIFGEVIAKQGLRQLRIAETTKYAHVTFFFNGGEERVFPGEDRALIKTKDVATFDLLPEMSAYEVCDEVVRRIDGGEYNVVILNYANCDMVGHTGIIPAAVRAVEVVDECVGKTVDAVLRAGGVAIITADHGNADRMVDSDGKTPFTAHTINPVPFIIAGLDQKDINLVPGRLCDITPTILDIMELEKPTEMTGQSLIKRGQ